MHTVYPQYTFYTSFISDTLNIAIRENGKKKKNLAWQPCCYFTFQRITPSTEQISQSYIQWRYGRFHTTNRNGRQVSTANFAESKECTFWGSPYSRNIYTKFGKNRSFSKLERGHEQWQKVSYYFKKDSKNRHSFPLYELNAYGGSGGRAPLINFGIMRYNFTSRPFHLRSKTPPRYPFGTNLDRNRVDVTDLQEWKISFSFRESKHPSALVRPYSRLTYIYRYAPHNDVSVNDEQHIRRWSHKTIISQYNIIILTIVFQLPTVFSTITCCTGL